MKCYSLTSPQKKAFVFLLLVFLKVQTSLQAWPMDPSGEGDNEEQQREQQQTQELRDKTAPGVNDAGNPLAFAPRGGEVEAVDPTLFDVDNDDQNQNDDTQNMDNSTISSPVLPNNYVVESDRSSPAVGGAVANKRGQFERVSVTQVPAGAPHSPSIPFAQVLNNPDLSRNITSMLLGSPEEKLEQYEKQLAAASDSRDEQKVAALTDAVRVLESASAYKNSFLDEEAAIDERTGNSKQPFIKFAQSLNERGPVIQKNITKLLTSAEQILTLHELRNNLRQQIATAAANTDDTTSLQAAERNTTQSINLYLSFSEKMRAGNIPEARVDYANADAAFYGAQEGIARNNNQDAGRFYYAALAAKGAADSFAAANQPGISQEEKNARLQAGNCRLQQAQAGVANNDQDEARFGQAAKRLETAICYFTRANRPELSEEEKNAQLQVGNYRLKQAQAVVANNDRDAKRFRKAADIATRAVGDFSLANRPGTSEKEKNAHLQAANYRLQEAQAGVDNKDRDAERFSKAADIAGTAGLCFSLANRPEFSQEDRDQYLQQANDELQKAAFYASDKEEAKSMTFEQYAEQRTKEEWKPWYRESRNPQRPPAWRGL